MLYESFHGSTRAFKRKDVKMGLILLIIVLLLLLSALPSWRHSKNWGYYPSGGLGLLFAVLIVLVLMGQIPFRM